MGTGIKYFHDYNQYAKVVKCDPPSESTTAVESSEPLSERKGEEASSRHLSKSSSADSAVEATEETLAGEEEEVEGKKEKERTSCDMERLEEEERERMSFAEIPTH